MPKVRNFIAPFPNIRIFSSHAVPIIAPGIEEEDENSYPSIQPANIEPNKPNTNLPIICSVINLPLIPETQVLELPRKLYIPLLPGIIEDTHENALFDIIDPALIKNQEYFEVLPEFTIEDLPSNFDETLISPIEFEISNNLLRRIHPPKKVVGMNYASRYWEETNIRLPGFERKRRSKKEGEKLIRPIQRGQIGNKPVSYSRQKPSFWDLIFIVLQPPINLNLPKSLALPNDLYSYQVKGVEFLISNEHALLADDMGTGKTVMSLVALKILMQQGKIKKALIVCPPSVLHEWKRHLEDWTPELIATFVRGTKQIRELTWGSPSHVYVTAYSTLRNDVRSGRLSKDHRSYFDLVIIDEAHHIKNPSTAQSKAVRSLQPNYRWALTGTPVQNSLDDMLSLFDFIYPTLLTQFDSEERVKDKIAPYFLRRRKSEVMTDLLPKIYQELELELDRDQQRAYEQLERESQLEIIGLGTKVTKTHIFAKLTALKQICNFAPGKNTSPKLEDIKDRIEEIIESGQKVIVFSQYMGEGINKLENGLKPYKLAKIVGGQSDTVRSTEIDKFKHHEDTHILLASVRSGGEGLNLAEASYVIHFDHWWNPAVMWQAEDRAHRHGQKNSVNIYSYWMLDTIDERIKQILARKGILIENVVDGLAETVIEEQLSINELLEIIGLEGIVPEKPKFEAKQWQNLSLEQIRLQLYEIKPFEFEDMVQQLMHYLGFPNVKVTKRSGDGGVDVLSSRNTENGIERIAAQCKRYRGTVGVRIAREFLGAIQDDPTIVKGYLITTGEFTQDCIAFCYRNNIEMISGLKIAEYVKKFSLSVS